MRTHRFFLLTFIVAALAWLVSESLAQETPNRAALVVSLGDGGTETRCVEFPEANISGFELLQRSGLALEVDYQAGGAAVCRIQDTGCPANDCFCQCKGGPNCVYWSYWQQIDGAWRYSVAGAGSYRVEDGAVQGWSWGPGSVTEAIPPPSTAFDSVCSAPVVETNTPVPTSEPVILPTLAPPGSVSTATLMPSSTSTVSPTPTPTPASDTNSTATPLATVEASAPAVMITPRATVTREPQVMAASSSSITTPLAPDASDADFAEEPATGAAAPNSPEVADAVNTPDRDSEAVSAVSDSLTPVKNDRSSLATTPTATIVTIETNSLSTREPESVAVVGEEFGVPSSTVSEAPVLGQAEAENLAAPKEQWPQYVLFSAILATLGALFGLAYLRQRSGN